MAVITNKVLLASLGGIAAFVALYLTMPPRDLIVFLNGLLSGAMVSLLMLFVPFVWAALRNDGVFDRGRQFGLGSFLMSLSVAVGLCVSIYIQTYNQYSALFAATAFARWLAIWGAVLKVISPDFGLGVFFGRDRKTLILCSGAGVLISLVVIWLQDQ